MTTRVRSWVLSGALAGTLFSLGIAFVHHRWIAPLERRQAETQRELSSVQVHLHTSQSEMSAIKDREQEIARLRRGLDSLHENVPIGPAIAWFPTRLKEQLAASGVADAEVRLNTSAAVPGLPGYEWTYWHVSLPPQAGLDKVSDALRALAHIAQQDRFVRLMDFSLYSGAGETASATGRMNVMAFVRK